MEFFLLTDRLFMLMTAIAAIVATIYALLLKGRQKGTSERSRLSEQARLSTESRVWFVFTVAVAILSALGAIILYILRSTGAQ